MIIYRTIRYTLFLCLSTDHLFHTELHGVSLSHSWILSVMCLTRLHRLPVSIFWERFFLLANEISIMPLTTSGQTGHKLKCFPINLVGINRRFYRNFPCALLASKKDTSTEQKSILVNPSAFLLKTHWSSQPFISIRKVWELSVSSSTKE